MSFGKVDDHLDYGSGYKAISKSPTIRTVISDSPDKLLSTVGTGDHHKNIPAEPTNDLYVDPAIRARGLYKTQNRWQQTLNDESPVGSRALRASEETNPYRLGSIPTSPRSVYLPMSIHHAGNDEDPFTRRKERDSREQERCTISPSVYSREPGATSTRSTSPIPNIGTVITITGREIKRYSLDSPTKVQPKSTQVRTSYE